MDKFIVWTTAKYCRPWTLSHYQSKTRDLLIALGRVDQRFLNLTSVGSDESVQVPQDLHELEELIRKQVFDEHHPDDYLELSSDGRLSAQSLSKIGFSSSFGYTSVDSGSLQSVEQGGIDLSIRGGSFSGDRNASTVLQLQVEANDAVDQNRLLKSLLRATLDHWDCSFGGVLLPRYQQAVRGSDFDSYAGQWLFYLPFQNLANCLPEGIATERFGSGMLIEATPGVPDANDPNDVAAGKKVRDALDDLGLVWNSTYAITGWPPDREESIYEQFISGAPPDRKYTVHCVNFDGYDPDRKVLLYAKLFRPLKRHPKEWGLRGWDGPVLNEAKRQVRAAEKAGGMPIEWHIGLEEPARQVRQLLADHTNIVERQLRVIYTPLEEALGFQRR